MQVVIDIPETYYEYCKAQEDAVEIQLAIKKGTPLPKGHGRLIDESKIRICGWNYVEHHAKADAPTIIEADRNDE